MVGWQLPGLQSPHPFQHTQACTLRNLGSGLYSCCWLQYSQLHSSACAACTAVRAIQ